MSREPDAAGSAHLVRLPFGSSARESAHRIASRFRSRFHRGYVKWKLRADPLYDELATLLGRTRLPVLDIGCGLGLLAFHLRERGINVPVTGLDFDEAKVLAAREVAAHYAPEPRFHVTDACASWPDIAGHICLLDVLQYLDRPQQQALLVQAAAHLPPGGLLVIRTGLREAGLRHRLTVLTDRAMALLGLMKSLPRSYPTRTGLQETLAASGLQLREDRPLHHGTPFNNHLLVFSRA